MNETNDLALVLVFAFGALLGLFFFGGLWWTVRKGVTSKWPAVWFLASLLLRTSVVLGGFLFISQGHWLRLTVCFLGFVIARTFVVTRFAIASEDVDMRLKMEAHRAT